MVSYAPPVDRLLKLGDPDKPPGKIDYLALGVGREHVPDLLRMLTDEELYQTEPEWYAQNHAWRALDQLQACEAIEPLLELVASNAIADSWSDWVLEEVPEVLGRFGPEVIARVLARFDRQKPKEAREYANVITEVAKQHPETRAEVVSHLRRWLETAGTNDPTLNAFLISNLIDLKATEAWLSVESAYATGNVDRSLNGDLDQAKFYLGLGPNPQRTRPDPVRPAAPSAKQRYNERQRQKKLAKKQLKNQRKGK